MRKEEQASAQGQRTSWFSEETTGRVEWLVSAAGVPGCVVHMVSAARRPGDSMMAVGLADVATRRPMTGDSVFHLFSGTKVITAAALMLLVERGALTLDHDVRELVPQLSLPHRVTLRQLACHSSGLPDTLRGFLAIHYPEEPRPTTGEALGRFDFARSKRPGQRIEYRNSNYAVLAEIISRVAGMSYERFVCSELLEPWASKATFEVSSVPRDKLATGYVRRFDPMRFLIPWLAGESRRRPFQRIDKRLVSLREFDLDSAGIGGLLGSAADFAPVLAEFLSAEDGVLEAGSKREMLTLQARGQAGVAAADGVGIAWKCGEIEGARFWNHEGGGPGFCTELRLYPADRVGFVIMMNLSQSERLSLMAQDICELLRRSYT